MNLFASFRRYGSGIPLSRGAPRTRLLLVQFSAGLLLTVSAGAQQQTAGLPSAPRPDLSVQTKSLSNVTGSANLASDAATESNATAADDVSLYTVVDLALRNSNDVRAAEASQQRARGAWMETRDAYIPNLSIGSGLGYSYGFPIGGPSLFNVTSTSLLFSFSQHDYIRSARAAWKAATLTVKNARQQVILDAALHYIELDNTLKEISALDSAAAESDRMITIMEDRMNAGLESKLNVTRAQLTRAQTRLRRIQMQDHAEELRKHLSGLTGIDAGSITPVASSIPQLPDVDFHSLMQASAKVPSVQAAFATADSRMFGARADQHQNYRPTVGMAAQYERFSTFNGYQQYYLSFQSDNMAVGIQAVWPLFDPIRRDKAMESKAQAVRARRQAELMKTQTDETSLALWHSLRELQAQEEVAKLQQQLAEDTLASTTTQMNQGATSADGAPITPQEDAQRRIQERSTYVDLEDAQFNVARVKLNLLNAAGELEDWAKESARPAAGGPAAVIQPHVPSR